MRRYGKVKLVIRNQRFFIESTEQKVLHQLLCHPDIRAARKGGTSGGRLIQTMERRREANFGMGNDEQYITTVDADGVALAAIQQLYDLVLRQQAEIQGLKERLGPSE